MKLYRTTALLAALPLAGVLIVPPNVTAGEDRSYYEREERSSSTRLSTRDQRSFEGFLDSHWETAQELYRDPELVDNKQFLRGHRDLRDWMEEHPDAAEAIRADPRAVIWRERASEGRERSERRSDTMRMSERDLASFESYLDKDWDTAQQLYQNPDLINDRRFVRNHDSLRNWLEDHPDAAEVVQANPHKFLWRERTSSAQDFLRQLLQ